MEDKDAEGRIRMKNWICMIISVENNTITDGSVALPTLLLTIVMVLGELGPGQLGPGQLGPGLLGPGQLGSGAQLSTFGGEES